jgi:hypothetical protein
VRSRGPFPQGPINPPDAAYLEAGGVRADPGATGEPAARAAGRPARGSSGPSGERPAGTGRSQPVRPRLASLNSDRRSAKSLTSSGRRRSGAHPHGRTRSGRSGADRHPAGDQRTDRSFPLRRLRAEQEDTPTPNLQIEDLRLVLRFAARRSVETTGGRRSFRGETPRELPRP